VAHAAVKGWLQPSSLLSASKTESAPEPRHIIFTSSFLAFLPILGYSPYSPAKAALRNLADTLAMETKLYESTHVPIRVHTIFPATIFTEGFENENKTKPDVTKKLEEDDGGQTPEEVARMAMKGLENGEEMITTTLMTRFAMSGMMGGSMRSGWVVLDVLLGMVSAIAMPFIRMWLHGEVKKWGAANGGSGAKKVS
jgi:3-dehydrosphinganine reductase